MGRRPRVNSCQSEGFGYEKCDQVKPIIAAQKLHWRKCGCATCCSSSNLLELWFGDFPSNRRLEKRIVTSQLALEAVDKRQSLRTTQPLGLPNEPPLTGTTTTWLAMTCRSTIK